MAVQTLGDVAVRVRGDTSGLKGDISKGTDSALTGAEPGIAQAGRRSGGKFGAAFAVASKVGIAGVATVATAVGAVIGKTLFGGFKRLENIDAAKAKLRGLGYEGERLKKVMDLAMRSVEGTPFALDAAAQAAGVLAASGVKLKDMEGTLKNIGNLASAAGTDFNYISSLFAEVAANNGQLNNDVIARIQQSGVAITQWLSKTLGVSSAAVKDMAKNGEISMAEFNEAVAFGAGKAAAEMGKSWRGITANISTRLSKIGAQILGPTFEAMKGQLSGFNTFLAKVIDSKRFEKFGNALGNTFTKISAGVRSIFSGGGGEGQSKMMAQLAKTGAALQKFAAPIGKVLKELGGEAVKKLAPMFKQLSETFTNDFLPALQKILPVLSPVVAFIVKLLGGAIIGAIKGIISILIGAVKIISGILNIIAGIFTGDWGRVWEGVKQIFSGAVKAILGILQFFWNVGILKIFKLGWMALKAIVTGGWKAIVNFFKTGTRTVTVHLDLAWALIKQGFSKLWTGMKSILSKGWEGVASFFRSIPGRVKGFFSGAGGWLKGVGQDIIGGLTRGIRFAAGKVKAAVDWIIGNIPGWAKKILGIGSPSKVMAMEVGRWIPAGIGEGIDFGFGDLRKQVNAMSGGITIEAVGGVPRAPRQAGTSTQPSMGGITNNTDRRSFTYAPIFTGPTTSGGRLREMQWTQDYATNARPEVIAGVPT